MTSFGFVIINGSVNRHACRITLSRMKVPVPVCLFNLSSPFHARRPRIQFAHRLYKPLLHKPNKRPRRLGHGLSLCKCAEAATSFSNKSCAIIPSRNICSWNTFCYPQSNTEREHIEEQALQPAMPMIEAREMEEKEFQQDADVNGNDEADEVSSKLLEEVGKGLAAGIAEGLAKGEAGNNGDIIRKLKEFTDGEHKIRLSPEAFLNKTERLLLNNLDKALHSGDLFAVQEALATVGENPKSAKAVLNAMKERIENANPRNSVRWETGTDSNGETVVRLHITQREGKLGDVTKVMVGSDGTHSASTVKVWDSHPGTQLDPGQTLRGLLTPIHRWEPIPKPPFREPIYRYQDLEIRSGQKK